MQDGDSTAIIQLMFSSTVLWTLHRGGMCFFLFCCISVTSKCTKENPTKPREAFPVRANISQHVTHGYRNGNLRFDRTHFIFSCVISDRCLRGLISVPRSLLLFTWETDTFLNAYNCREEQTRLFDLPCCHTGFSGGGGWRYNNVLNVILF